MDLNLVGREYVFYRGKAFPAFFTYASRNAMKRNVVYQISANEKCNANEKFSFYRGKMFC